ncbi:MAG TPA: MurT ligase domain-containing protein [Ktedonobacteraceae bacterium]|nr:MurT ligase domain-containing protein [Ktedonobacteraceae bacterium]
MRKQGPSQPLANELDEPAQGRKTSRTKSIIRKHGLQNKHQKKQRLPRRHPSLRAGLAVIAGRAAGALSRRLHLGAGTSIVGVVAQRIYPQIVEHLATELEHGSVMVTGTNGKTTTSSFIAAILRDGGLRVWRNREGSNLMRGVASSLVIRAQPNGHLRRAGRAISILEVDEAALPQVASVIHPRIVVFTNLFRDQLDRYGEVHSIVTHWQRAVSLLPPEATLVLNADDPTIAQLGASFEGRVLYYGVDDLSLNLLTQQNASERHQVIDTRTCPQCGSEYSYDVRFYSHIGHYHCPNCGKQRPQPDVRATQVQLDGLDRLRIQVTTGEQQREIVVPLPGLYNIYNALAAITAARALDIDWEPISSGIEQFKPAFGRGERIQAEGKTMRLLLAKNPTGFNEVLRTLFSDATPRHMLFVLNDNIADGRDISWIWDVDFERLAGKTQTFVVAGTRALDLALRLKYAGVDEEDMTIIPSIPLRVARREANRTPRQIGMSKRGMRAIGQAIETLEKHPDKANDTLIPSTRMYGLKNALEVALNQTPVNETLFVVPTYTALLEVHHELEQRGLTPHYWEGGDT